MTISGWPRTLTTVVLAASVTSGINWPKIAAANGFRNPPESASALGKVGARYALVDDASASAFNPANLTKLDTASAMISMNFVHGETEYTSPLGQTSTTEDPWKFLPNAFVAWPDKGWVFALGVTTPFGQSTEWKKDSAFQYTAPYFAEMKVVNVNPTVARKLTDTIAVGAGVDVFWSQLDLRQMFPWSMVTHNMLDVPGRAKFEGDGTGVGGNAGITWQFTPRQLLALSYRSPVKVNYDGDFEISQIPATAMALPKTDFETDIEFPDIVGLGYGVKITDTLRLGVDVEWIKFSRFDSLPLDIGPDSPLLPAATIPEDWDDTWTAGAGAEWAFSPDWVLRAGYIFMESPVPEDTLAPTLPDGDQHVVSTGLGYRKGAHAFDVAYAVGFNANRTVDENVNPAYVGEYDIKTSHMVQSAYSIAF
jgi:long-chain fatty acid transport protein